MVMAMLSGNGTTQEVQSWQGHVETALSVFRHLLKDNPLAARCADILDRILQPEPDTSGLDVINFLNSSDLDFSSWPGTDSDLLGSFGWLDSSQGDEG
jgi:transcriptional regulatory protein GAL4